MQGEEINIDHFTQKLINTTHNINSTMGHVHIELRDKNNEENFVHNVYTYK